MSAGFDLLVRLTAFRLWHRDQHNSRLSKRHLYERDAVMKFIDETETEIDKLIAGRQASDHAAATEKARADTAEAEVATLNTQIAADEAKLKKILDKVTAEVGAEAPTGVDTGVPGNDLVEPDVHQAL